MDFYKSGHNGDFNDLCGDVIVSFGKAVCGEADLKIWHKFPLEKQNVCLVK